MTDNDNEYAEKAEKLEYAKARLGLAHIMGDVQEAEKWSKHVAYWQDAQAQRQALKERHGSALHAALEAWKYAEGLVEAGLTAGTLDYAAVEAARAEARRLTDLECQLYNLLNRKG
jgi:hypothetical protein